MSEAAESHPNKKPDVKSWMMRSRNRKRDTAVHSALSLTMPQALFKSILGAGGNLIDGAERIQWIEEISCVYDCSKMKYIYI